MKLLLITVLIFAMASPYQCTGENEEGWVTEFEMEPIGYEAEDVAARKAIAEWNQFLAASDAVVDAACIKISIANDKLEDPQCKNKRKLRHAIIRANNNIDKLTTMLLSYKALEPRNYRLDNVTIRAIKSFKEEFSHHREKLEEALTEMTILMK